MTNKAQGKYLPLDYHLKLYISVIQTGGSAYT